MRQRTTQKRTNWHKQKRRKIPNIPARRSREFYSPNAVSRVNITPYKNKLSTGGCAASTGFQGYYLPPIIINSAPLAAPLSLLFIFLCFFLFWFFFLSLWLRRLPFAIHRIRAGLLMVKFIILSCANIINFCLDFTLFFLFGSFSLFLSFCCARICCAQFSFGSFLLNLYLYIVKNLTFYIDILSKSAILYITVQN